MARELSSRLDLDEPEETRLYNAYASWRRELQAALDADGDGRVSADEYRALFRTAFHRDTTSTGGTYSRSAFINDFLTFMSGRLRTTPYHPLRPPPRRSMTRPGERLSQVSPFRIRRAATFPRRRIGIRGQRREQKPLERIQREHHAPEHQRDEQCQQHHDAP
jgi:hypothetical protein